MPRFLTKIAILATLSPVHGFTATTTPYSTTKNCRNHHFQQRSIETNLSSVSVRPQHSEFVATTDDKETTQLTAKSWQDDGFVFGLEGSGLERPKGKQAVTVVEGDSLETKPYQVAIVTATFLAHSAFLATSYVGMLQTNGGNVVWTTVQAVLMTVASWVLADFGSGVLHWSVDNYGNGKTPIMGSIIAAFQGHHSAPWTITERKFCNNVYKLCIPFGIAPMAVIAAVTGPFTTFFMTLFCIFEILSQEFHKWSHMLKSETPEWVNVLQKLGLTVPRKMHAQHHLAPFDGNYSIISGITNKVLDQTGFFRRLEHIVFKLNGVESNAWKLDPELRARTLAGDYTWMPNEKTASSSATKPSNAM